MKRRTRQDYYTALGVSRDASAREIRDAFREMAKRRHPDKNRGNPRARALFEETVNAYKTLSNEAARRDYDRNIPPRPDTPINLCGDLFALLLAEQTDEALETLNKLLERVQASVCALDLRLYLNDEDARDCEFLIAEALEMDGQRDAAILLYERSLMREARRPHFRIFAEEIRLRLRRLRFDKLIEKAGGESGGLMAPKKALEPIVQLGATPKQQVSYYQQLAAALEGAGHIDSARRSMQEARLLSKPNAPRVEAEESRAQLQTDAGI